jgi:hypothetical protein
MLAAIAGVTLNAESTRQKLYQAKCKAQAAFKWESFFEEAFVNRVKQRNYIRIRPASGVALHDTDCHNEYFRLPAEPV